MTEMLRFWAFQQWFRIENRTIIKDFGAILLIFVSFGLPQTIGGAFIREGATIRDNMVFMLIDLKVHIDEPISKKSLGVFSIRQIQHCFMDVGLLGQSEWNQVCHLTWFNHDLFLEN